MPCYKIVARPEGDGQVGQQGYATEEDCLNACKEGACCEADGTCNVRPQCQCQGATQTFRGIGTTCEPNPCLPCNACCASPCSNYGSVSGCSDLSMDIAFSVSTSTATQGNDSAPDCTTLSTTVPATSSAGAAANFGCFWQRGTVQSPVRLPVIQSDPNADAVGENGYIGGFTAAHEISVRGSVQILSGCVARVTLTIDSWYISVARYTGPREVCSPNCVLLGNGSEIFWLFPQYAGTQNPYPHTVLPDYVVASDVPFNCISDLSGQGISITASFPRFLEGFYDNFASSSRQCTFVQFFNEIQGQPFATATEATLQMSIASLGPLP